MRAANVRMVLLNKFPLVLAPVYAGFAVGASGDTVVYRPRHHEERDRLPRLGHRLAALGNWRY